jgi:hypothetical protein
VTRVTARESASGARLVWLIAAVGVAVIGLLVASYVQMAAEPTPGQAFAAFSLVGSLLAFILCGALIVSRQPRNLVGWLLMIPGLVVPAGFLATEWLGATPPPRQVTPALWLVLWALSWAWIVLIFPILHLLLTFPDGRLLSGRWRWVVALEVVMVAIFLGFCAFKQTLGVFLNDETVWTVANPIGFLANDMFDRSLGVLWEVGLVFITIASATAVVLRFRRGSTMERQQLKWPVLAVVLFGVVYGGAAIESSLVGDGSILFGLALAGIPISVAIAVLRYRLYAIDHIISRTVSWAVITAVLVTVFAGGLLGLQAALAGVTQAPTLAVAASTLAACALFQPIRGRVQHAVDRRFDRARFDAERTASSFSDRLRGEVAIDSIAADLQTTIDRSMRPATQGLWLRVARDRPAASGS